MAPITPARKPRLETTSLGRVGMAPFMRSQDRFDQHIGRTRHAAAQDDQLRVEGHGQVGNGNGQVIHRLVDDGPGPFLTLPGRLEDIFSGQVFQFRLAAPGFRAACGPDQQYRCRKPRFPGRQNPR